jgi:hypothetical protein
VHVKRESISDEWRILIVDPCSTVLLFGANDVVDDDLSFTTPEQVGCISAANEVIPDRSIKLPPPTRLHPQLHLDPLRLTLQSTR